MAIVKSDLRMRESRERKYNIAVVEHRVVLLVVPLDVRPELESVTKEQIEMYLARKGLLNDREVEFAGLQIPDLEIRIRFIRNDRQKPTIQRRNAHGHNLGQVESKALCSPTIKHRRKAHLFMSKTRTPVVSR